eukprot:4058516-Prymnesium_polylepis.1
MDHDHVDGEHTPSRNSSTMPQPERWPSRHPTLLAPPCLSPNVGPHATRPYSRAQSNNNAGVGVEETLTVYSVPDNVPRLRMRMPRHRSFGIGANLTDATGKVVACT